MISERELRSWLSIWHIVESTALILRLAEYTALVLRLAMGNAFEAMVLLWENGTIVGNSIEG